MFLARVEELVVGVEVPAVLVLLEFQELLEFPVFLVLEPQVSLGFQEPALVTLVLVQE